MSSCLDTKKKLIERNRSLMLSASGAVVLKLLDLLLNSVRSCANYNSTTKISQYFGSVPEHKNRPEQGKIIRHGNNNRPTHSISNNSTLTSVSL